MKALLMEIMESKVMTNYCDKASSAFNGLTDSEVKKLQVKCEIFDQKLLCLDKFTIQKFKFKTKKHFASLWKSYFHSVMDKPQ